MKNLEAKYRQDAKPLRKIQMGVSRAYFAKIATCETAKEAWDSLKTEVYGDKKKSMSRLLLSVRRPKIFLSFPSKSQKHLLHSRNLKPLLRSKKVAASKPFVVIDEVNIQVENLKNITKMKAFRSNLQQGVLLNQKVYLKKEIQ